MKRILFVLSVLLVFTSPALAVDGSILNAQATITGAKSLKLTNVTVNGLPGTYWGEFFWDTNQLAFTIGTYGTDATQSGKAEGQGVMAAANSVDGSILNSEISIAGEKTIKLKKISINGLSGTYWAEFTWDPAILGFKLGFFGADSATSWREVRIDADYDLDGNTDEVTTYSYDNQGLLIGSFDNDLLDLDDIKETFTYDANGRLIRDEIDLFPYGSIDEAGTYTYDSNDRLISRREDMGNNGSIDAVETYIYDANNRVVRVDEDSDNNGSIDSTTHYVYDGNGKAINRKEDFNNDGIIDAVAPLTYDERGNPVRADVDENNDGVVDQIGYYTYDENNNLIKEEYDEDNNGSIDEHYIHTWEQGPCSIGGLEDTIPDIAVFGYICN